MGLDLREMKQGEIGAVAENRKYLFKDGKYLLRQTGTGNLQLIKDAGYLGTE